KAQLILPTHANTFDQYPNFNVALVKNFKIRSLTFDILDKKDYQAGKDIGLVHHYDFDTGGRLTRFYYTALAKTIVKEIHVGAVKKRRHKAIPGYIKYANEYVFDTISTRFFYDVKGRLILKRYNEGMYYESTYFDYDEKGRVLREMRCKETNVSADKNQFTLGVQNVISEEKFEYQSTGEKQYKKKCLNDEGRIFREVIVNLDDAGNPTEFNENFTVTWISQQSKFIYDEFGRMKQRSFESNTDGTQAIRDTFEYDNRGNITWERQYKNGVLLNERSYLFDEKNELVTSYVIRDHIQKSMRITKLIYEYYSK
ncbi:MAG: hypothetical protein IAF38_19245, partial [Bacteroidia bacterium]|nr:hypothetical protein [Bacteroidia bacterium]